MALEGDVAGRAWRARPALAAPGVWAGRAAWGEHCLQEKQGKEKHHVGGAPQPCRAPQGRPVEHSGPTASLGCQPGIPRGAFPAQTRLGNPPTPISPIPPRDRPFSGLPATSPAPPVPVAEAQGKAGRRGCGWEAMVKLGPGLSGHSAGSAPGKKEREAFQCAFAQAVGPVGPSSRQPPLPATQHHSTNLPALCQTFTSTCTGTQTACQTTIALPTLSSPVPPFVHHPWLTCTSQARCSNPKHHVKPPFCPCPPHTQQ